MKLVRLILAAILLGTLSLIVSLPAQAAETVTPDEIITKVHEAAKFLSEKGEAGLAQFNDPKGPWAWKDTYVFVFDCSRGIIVAHPNKDLVGTKLALRVDKNGLKYDLSLCEEAKKPLGGWVEYWRPSDVIDETGTAEYQRKISYMLKVQGRPYEVGAGIYEPTLTVDELNKMLEK